jgi:hypothetical protein
MYFSTIIAILHPSLTAYRCQIHSPLYHRHLGILCLLRENLRPYHRGTHKNHVSTSPESNKIAIYYFLSTAPEQRQWR